MTEKMAMMIEMWVLYDSKMAMMIVMWILRQEDGYHDINVGNVIEKMDMMIEMWVL